MVAWGIKLVFGVLFVVLALLLMFTDSQYHIGYESKASMVFEHAEHAAEEHEEESDDHHDDEEGDDHH
jgi:hypothetical protein